jgi:hypothetical protein
MKNFNTLILTLFLAMSANFAFSQARLQVIHNSADMNADTVDVWLNNNLLLDNFAFRTASPFIDAPSDIDFDVTIQPKNSTDTLNPVAKFTYNLEAGKTYVIIANGIIDQTKYSGENTFNLYVYDMGREKASQMGNTDVLVFHGSTDAPTVDIYEAKQSISEVKDNLMYGEFAGYLELPTLDYSFQVRTETGQDVVAQFSAPLAGLNLHDSALLVLASGFLNPASNNNGPEFGLFVALPTGGNLIELSTEEVSTSRLQVVHNSGDALADSVDVYVNGALLLNNFAYHTATPFIDVPSGVDLNINIAPKNSNDSSEAVARFTYNLTGSKKYILVANGLLDNSSYSPFKPFNLAVYDMGREMAMDPMKVDLNIFHGSTDAPTVDIFETDVLDSEVYNDLMYEKFSGYVGLDNNDYTLEIRDETGGNKLFSYMAPISKLNVQGQSFLAIASGFVNPADNNNGEEFGLFLVPATGGNFIELDQTSNIEKEIISESSIFPNPVQDDLNLKFSSDGFQILNLTIYDLQGRELMNSPYTVHDGINFISLNLSDLRPGNYVIRIANDEGFFQRKINKK